MDIKEVAKEIRAILKVNFPATKFSVTISRFSMGESVDTAWTDGPTKPQVDALIGGYGDTRYRFIKTSRKHSIEFADKVIKAWKEQNPEYAHFAITSQGKVDCYGIAIGDELYGSNDIRQDCEDSIYRFLRSSTLDSLSLVTPPEITHCEPEIISTPEPETVAVEIAAEEEVTPQPQPIQLDLVDTGTLEADRQQAYAQYLASQQEADALEAKLAVKKTEAQVYFAIMKEIDEKIEAKKREAEVTTTAPTQPDFDVKAFEGKRVTLLLVNTMGFPVCRHVTITTADIVSAKRYQGDMTDKMCLQLQYIEKGKRKPRGTRYTEADLAIVLGWQQIQVPNEFTIFEEGLLNTMVRQAKDVVYTQQDLLR